MEEQDKQIEELAPEPRQGSGSILATARKQQQKTIEEIANELNLSVAQIKSIELDQTDGLPEPTYVRGYIRAYAKLLGLVPEEVLHNYLNPNWQQSSSLNDIPKGIGSAEQDSSRFFSLGKIIVLLLFIAVVAALWYTGVLQQIMAGRESSTTANATDSSTVTEVREVGSSDETALSEGTALENAGQDVSSDPDSEQATPAETDATAADGALGGVTASNQLVMQFSATSWVDIRDSNDDRLAYKSYTDGDTLEINEAGEMQVFIGNAEGVTVTLNNEAFSLDAHREGVYAKFVIPPAQ